MKTHPPLQKGYSAVAPGQIANVVTCLEMRDRPATAVPEDENMAFRRWNSPAPDDYRALYRAVGENWLWVERLVMSDDVLSATLAHPDVETYCVEAEGERIGLLELDFHEPGACEIVYCGLVAGAIGRGAGAFLMANALHTAWSRTIDRVWLHTCNFDHPSAIAFYGRSGFTPYSILVEVMDDPRLSGNIPRTAAPHVPLLEA